jgi:hypothetical protein
MPWNTRWRVKPTGVGVFRSRTQVKRSIRMRRHSMNWIQPRPQQLLRLIGKLQHRGSRTPVMSSGGSTLQAATIGLVCRRSANTFFGAKHTVFACHEEFGASAFGFETGAFGF